MPKVKSQIDALIGHRLRAARLYNNLSQHQLGDQIGISFQQIQKYENATNRISAVRVLFLARALDLPVTYFFDCLDNSVIPTGDPSLPENVIRDARLLAQIDDRHIRDGFFNLIKACSEAA